MGIPLAPLVPRQAAARISVSLAGNIPCGFARLLDAAGEDTPEGGQCVPMDDRSDGIRADLERTQVAMVERFQTYLLELKGVERELRRSLLAVQERLRGLDSTKAGILAEVQEAIKRIQTEADQASQLQFEKVVAGIRAATTLHVGRQVEGLRRLGFRLAIAVVGAFLVARGVLVIATIVR